MQLVFANENKDIFEMLKSGEKSLETRAAIPEYRLIKQGDIISFLCDGDLFEKRVANVEIFPSVSSLLEKYQPELINPKLKTREEIIAMYHSFPGYQVKLQQYGILAIEL